MKTNPGSVFGRAVVSAGQWVVVFGAIYLLGYGVTRWKRAIEAKEKRAAK